MTEENRLVDRLRNVSLQSTETEAVRERQYPAGWAPGVQWEGDRGELTTPAVTETPGNWDEYLERYGLDPEIHEVVEDTIRFTAWDGWKRDHPDEAAYNATMFSFRAAIRLKSYATHSDWSAIYADIRKKKPLKKKAKGGDATWIVALSDWQIGNDEGGGVEAQIVALDKLIRDLPEAFKVANAVHPIGEIVIAGMGDLFENCDGFYAHQAFTVELDRREQAKVIRHALYEIIMVLHPLAPKITVLAVGGNHGENRTKGNKYTTTRNDNDDVAVFEALAEGFAMNERFSNINWKLPAERLAVSHRVGDQIVAFTHGHVARSRGGAINTMWEWWKGQALGRHYPGVADAEILVTGHYHHFNAKEQEGRSLFICPSLTKVSEYFGDATGVRSQPGTLTMIVTGNSWDMVRRV